MNAPISRLRVLHLEDSPADAELIAALLRSTGLECHIERVDSKQDFVKAIEQGGFDLILSDYTMPGFNGIAALRMAREKCPDVPFVFVSGTIGEDRAAEAILEGATDYVLKDRLHRLGDSIARALGKPQDTCVRARSVKMARESAEAYRLSSAINELELELERSRLARELHDSVTQLIGSARFRIQGIEEKLTPLLRAELTQIGNMLGDVLREIRQIIGRLRQGDIDRLGLVAAIERLCAEFRERTGVATVFGHEGSQFQCNDEAALHLYRIVQESLRNIEKHAAARHVAVRLSGIQLVIEDDGRGFDVAARRAASTGLGLLNMEERAQLLGGAVEVWSVPGQGARITVRLPE